MSINQNANTSALPNFRNLGILLRILVVVNAMGIAVAAIKSDTPAAAWQELLVVSATIQPPLLLALLTLVAVHPALTELPYWLSSLAVLAIALAAALVANLAGFDLFGAPRGGLLRQFGFTIAVTAVLLGYFNLRGRALSPALTEARLQALQARIRPHFLFNSINAVLSLIRQDPKRAEMALEDMADLFRVLMADNRQLAPIGREVALCRQYLGIEQLRLGERLVVEWHVDAMPPDALIPPLLLQPLLENAVYHGIEPRTEPGTVAINIFLSRNQVVIVLRNPFQDGGSHHTGNRMAVANIRERLALHYDAEATLTTGVRDGTYEVRIVMPYIRG